MKKENFNPTFCLFMDRASDFWYEAKYKLGTLLSIMAISLMVVGCSMKELSRVQVELQQATVENKVLQESMNAKENELSRTQTELQQAMVENKVLQENMDAEEDKLSKTRNELQQTAVEIAIYKTATESIYSIIDINPLTEGFPVIIDELPLIKSEHFPDRNDIPNDKIIVNRKSSDILGTEPGSLIRLDYRDDDGDTVEDDFLDIFYPQTIVIKPNIVVPVKYKFEYDEERPHLKNVRLIVKDNDTKIHLSHEYAGKVIISGPNGAEFKRKIGDKSLTLIKGMAFLGRVEQSKRVSGNWEYFLNELKEQGLVVEDSPTNTEDFSVDTGGLPIDTMTDAWGKAVDYWSQPSRESLFYRGADVGTHCDLFVRNVFATCEINIFRNRSIDGLCKYLRTHWDEISTTEAANRAAQGIPTVAITTRAQPSGSHIVILLGGVDGRGRPKIRGAGSFSGPKGSPHPKYRGQVCLGGVYGGLGWHWRSAHFKHVSYFSMSRNLMAMYGDALMGAYAMARGVYDTGLDSNADGLDAIESMINEDDLDE